MQNDNTLNAINVGLIGTGLMGYGIGVNLIKAGYNLFTIKHKNEKNLEKLEQMGAKLRQSYEDIALNCNYIVLCLPNSQAVEEVVTGEKGLINFIRSNAIIIDCTTSEPSSTEHLTKELIQRGVYFLDAPLNRSPKEALEGKLNILVGGDFNAYQKASQIIKSFSENIFYVGESGQGNKLKLFNNFISMSFTLVVIYTLAYAKKERMELDKLNEIMSKGSNYIPALPLMIKWLKNQDESVLEFSIKNACKDMTYFRNMVEEYDIDPKMLNCLVQIFDEAVQNGFGDKMLPELFNFFVGK